MEILIRDIDFDSVFKVLDDGLIKLSLLSLKISFYCSFNDGKAQILRLTWKQGLLNQTLVSSGLNFELMLSLMHVLFFVKRDGVIDSAKSRHIIMIDSKKGK